MSESFALIWQLIQKGFWLSVLLIAAAFIAIVIKTIYNISPFHPLAKYPGPLLWRASRIPASYHHASGDLYQRIAAIHDQYGPTVRIAPDELSFTNPEAWLQIYNSRPQLQKTKYHFAPPDARKLPESMITAPDTEHMRLRRLASPAFLNSGVNEVEPVLQRNVDHLCTELGKDSSKGSQNIVDWFLWTLTDVIGQLALDKDFECIENRRLHPWPHFLMRVLKTTASLNQFRRFGLPTDLLSYLLPKNLKAAGDMFFDTASTAVNQRLAREDEDDGSSKDRKDIVGLMLREMKGGDKLTAREITANSILIVGGGAETTSTCLSATIYHLCKTPRVMQKLKDEIRQKFTSSEEITIKAVSDMPYLKATIDESLRAFPVASYITPRVTPKDGHVIDGELIAGGTYVSMDQWYMARSSRFFDDAEEFRPERWLTTDVQEASGMLPGDILRPFSLGPRNCIGKLLALAEARLVLAKLLWHFDIELEGDHETWVEDARFYILWQLQPLNVRVTPVQS